MFQRTSLLNWKPVNQDQTKSKNMSLQKEKKKWDELLVLYAKH